jgi:hypothetical protein
MQRFITTTSFLNEKKQKHRTNLEGHRERRREGSIDSPSRRARRTHYPQEREVSAWPYSTKPIKGQYTIMAKTHTSSRIRHQGTAIFMKSFWLK